MVQTTEAEQIILARKQDYGNETIPFTSALDRILAEDVIADRNLPPYNRSTMDGIAISYAAFEKGIRAYHIVATLAAGDTPINTQHANECVEIMTGAALPPSTDTIIRYEDVEINNGTATIKIDAIKKGQNIHPEGKDKKQGDTVIKSPCHIDAAVISMAASVGHTQLLVKNLPRIIIITTGDEVVDAHLRPSPYQVRKSNSHTISAVLQKHHIIADTQHITDDLAITKERISHCLNHYDVIILSGGISMGKFDFIPQALEELQVTKLFHKVQQRPGKPFWFGMHQSSSTVVFAFPGNPVSGFMCLYRYFLPWLQASLGLAENKPMYAVLNDNVTFTPQLQYYIQVKLELSDNAQLIATPLEGHGSGDFANLLDSNAFMELPAEQSIFAKGEIYRVWPYKPIV